MRWKTDAPRPRALGGSILLSGYHFTEMCCGTETSSYLRLIDSCEAQGPSRTCNESKAEEEAKGVRWKTDALQQHALRGSILLSAWCLVFSLGFVYGASERASDPAAQLQLLVAAVS